MKEISINPTYDQLVRPLTKEEYTALKISIEEKGQLVDIILNSKREIIDGKHRFQICTELGINPKFKIQEFRNEVQESLNVIEINQKRRQLSVIEAVELSEKAFQIEYVHAKKRKMSNLKNQSSKSSRDLFEKGTTAKKLAARIGTSEATYKRAKVILNSKDEKLILLAKTKKQPINKAYNKVIGKQKSEQRKKELDKLKTDIPKSIKIYNKDFRDLKFKPNSIDLVFTDPPYLKDDMNLYAGMFEKMSKAIKPGGSLLTFTGHLRIFEVEELALLNGFEYYWLLVVLHERSNSSKMHQSKIHVNYKPILWFVKNKSKYQPSHVHDLVKSEFQGKDLHEWAQSTVESDYYIEHLSKPGDVVCDPFMGQGTFGLSAKKLGRNFVGCELDKSKFDIAKKFLSQ